jgi:hypothetical protein
MHVTCSWISDENLIPNENGSSKPCAINEAYEHPVGYQCFGLCGIDLRTARAIVKRG